MDRKTKDEQIHTIIEECVPLLKTLAKGQYAVTIGGSRGRRNSDSRSDIDFRVFCDEIVGGPEYAQYTRTEEWKPFAQAMERWQARGIIIDSCWLRTVNEVETQLSAWLSGQARPVEMEWCIWGYHLLTDINNQEIVEDPAGLIAGWQSRLNPYPPTLQQAILAKHLASLRYWRNDYHYRHKVERKDIVFLAGIAARLVHDMLQVLFALNKTYYVGDGNNLSYAAAFPIQPKDFARRVTGALYPPQSEDALEAQYATINKLIDDLFELTDSANGTEGQNFSGI